MVLLYRKRKPHKKLAYTFIVIAIVLPEIIVECVSPLFQMCNTVNRCSKKFLYGVVSFKGRPATFTNYN